MPAVGARPRFLVNGYGAYWGGIVRVHNELCRELAVRGAVAVANAPRDQVPDPALEVLSEQTESRTRSLIGDAVTVPRTRRPYDVRVDSAPALRLFTRSRRHIVVIHDLNFLRPDVHGISRKQWAYRQLLHRWTLRRASRVVVNSRSTLAELGSFMPAAVDKAVVLPLPVDHVGPSGKDARTGRRQEDGRLRLLTFGHARNKGVDRLLELLARRRNAQLAVVCRREQWESLWAPRARQLGVMDRVTVLSGLTDEELVNEYRAADVFCMLSTYEGYGLPVAEALCLGTPTVISDLAVLRDTSRGYAVVAPTGAADDLERAIERALDLPAARLDEAAEEFRRWTWSAWVDRMLEPAS